MCESDVFMLNLPMAEKSRQSRGSTSKKQVRSKVNSGQQHYPTPSFLDCACTHTYSCPTFLPNALFPLRENVTN